MKIVENERFAEHVIVLVDDHEIRALARVANALQNARESSGFGVFAGAPGRSSVASLSRSPAFTRSSLTPGRSAVARPPGAIKS